MKRITTLAVLLISGAVSSYSQTLQTVTNNGNVTTNSITIGTGYSEAKLNVNAIGADINNTQDMTVLITNQRYNSTNTAGDNRIVFGWANHWAAAIGAYKETNNRTGLKFFTEYGYNVPTESMRITSTGEVGIGTTTPQGYKLAVNGNIRAKEIKVENANWPDYVFEAGYQLRSLSETEKHIKEKGHLPGIPSAAEVAANGVELGEMNKELLEKIEELTLHLIEQNKKIEILEVQVKSLSKPVKP